MRGLIGRLLLIGHCLLWGVTYLKILLFVGLNSGRAAAALPLVFVSFYLHTATYRTIKTGAFWDELRPLMRSNPVITWTGLIAADIVGAFLVAGFSTTGTDDPTQFVIAALIAVLWGVFALAGLLIKFILLGKLS